tara:strand:- start:24692 stop:24943 length:252 start_codon:yes stop_codon:yes gene_type:complete
MNIWVYRAKITKLNKILTLEFNGRAWVDECEQEIKDRAKKLMDDLSLSWQFYTIEIQFMEYPPGSNTDFEDTRIIQRIIIHPA